MFNIQIRKLLPLFLLLSTIVGVIPKPVQAQKAGNCDMEVRDVSGNVLIPRTAEGTFDIVSNDSEVITVFYIDREYLYENVRVRFEDLQTLPQESFIADNGAGFAEYSARLSLARLEDIFSIQLEQSQSNSPWQGYCIPKTIRVNQTEGDPICEINEDAYADKILLSLSYWNFAPDGDYKIVFEDDDVIPEPIFTTNQVNGVTSLTIDGFSSIATTLKMSIRRQCTFGDCFGEGNVCEKWITLKNETASPDASPPVITPPVTSGPGGSGSEFSACGQAGPPGSPAYDTCNTCYQGGGIWTGIGCIPYTNTVDTVQAMVRIGIGVAGLFVVLMSLAGAFILSTSQGDPKRVDEGKALITSAISGILFIIFSVAILRFIGVTIFQIPGFG